MTAAGVHTGRRAVVGGASSGLGRACAQALAAGGAELLLWSRGRGPLEQTAEQLRSEHGATVHLLSADAADPDCAAQVAGAAAAAMGGVDVCVLNAGGPPPCPPDATDPDTWRRSLQLLTITPIDLATRLLAPMRARGFGRVVAVLSSGVREPLPELCYSNAGRSALAAWLKTVAGDGVTVNGVAPGRIDTARVAALDQARAARTDTTVEQVQAASTATIPAGRYGRAEEFAAVVDFLASPAAGYVTGSLLPCDGGMARSLL